MKKALKKKKGFTLIELIIVIAILGILAAIAVPRFAGTRETARAGADRANAKIIYDAATLLVENNTIGQNVADINVVRTTTDIDATEALGNSICDQLGDSLPTPQNGGSFQVDVVNGRVSVTWTGANSTAQTFPTP